MQDVPFRQDQAAITLTVDGRTLPWIFAKREGGMVDSEETKTRLGGLLPEVSIGGPSTVSNVTLVASLIPAKHLEDLAWLKTRAGRARATVSEQLLDVDGNTFGRPSTWSGVFKSCDPGQYDANSTDVREVTFELSTDGVV